MVGPLQVTRTRARPAARSRLATRELRSESWNDGRSVALQMRHLDPRSVIVDGRDTRSTLPVRVPRWAGSELTTTAETR